MIRNLTILSFIFSVICICHTGQAQINLLRDNPIPSSRFLDRFGLEVSWAAQATLQVGRGKIAQFAIDERSVVTVSTGGMVTLFDAESGDKKWVTRIGRGDQSTFMPAMNDDSVLVIVGLKLYSLDRLSGNITWEVNLRSMPSTGPTANNERIYMGALDGSVYAADLRKIKELYQERLLPDYSYNAILWRYKAAEKITSPPVSYGTTVSFASLDNSLYTVSANSRKLLYQFETDAPISAPLVLHRDSLYLASEDFNFYCLNARNGQVRWSFLSGLPIRRSPHVIEGTIRGVRTNVVYLLPETGGMTALDAANGLPIWPRPQTRAVDFRAATQNYLFVTNDINNILILERDFGEVIGLIPAVNFKINTSNSRTDRLFLAREDGLIVMIRERDSNFPSYHQYPDRKPITPILFDPEVHSESTDDSATPVPGDDDSPTNVPGDE